MIPPALRAFTVGVLFVTVTCHLIAGETAPDLFEPGVFTLAEIDGQLPYRLCRPERVAAGTRYPLVLHLHGAGERGDDNLQQLAHFRKPVTRVLRPQHPCFVIVPQCPKDGVWATYGWGTQDVTAMSQTPTKYLALVKALVDELVAKEPIDPDRVYITGISMGGYGTWEMIQRWPELFAAAVPICGGGDPGQAARLIALPIWAFHGAQDNVIKPENSTAMIEAITTAGGSPLATLYPGVGHDCWGRAYADAVLWTWLFEQRRSSRAGGQ